MQTKLEKKQKISFSEYITWIQCPWKRKVIYEGIEKEDGTIEFPSQQETIHLEFGNIIHKYIGLKLQEKNKEAVDLLKNHTDNKKFISMFKSISTGIDNLMQHIKEKKWTLIKHEYYLKNLIDFTSVDEIEKKYDTKTQNSINFSGIIDLIFFDAENKKYIIIDLKVCGWPYKEKIIRNSKFQYQLALYKQLFSKEYNVDINNIEQGFFFLIKGGKNNFLPHMITCTNTKIDNALLEIYKCCYGIQNKLNFKDRSDCKFCHLYNTKFCSL